MNTLVNMPTSFEN